MLRSSGVKTCENKKTLAKREKRERRKQGRCPGCGRCCMRQLQGVTDVETIRTVRSVSLKELSELESMSEVQMETSSRAEDPRSQKSSAETMSSIGTELVSQSGEESVVSGESSI